MKSIFKSILAVVVTASALFAPIQSSAMERGEKAFGVRTGYVGRNTSVDAGLFLQYTFSEHFRLEPAIDMVFRHKDRDAFTFDINAHVPFLINGDNFSLFPLAGLNYSSWNYHYPKVADVDFDRESDNVNSRKNNFGVNLGAGFDLRLSETLKLNLQGEYTLVKRNSGLRVLAGIAYIF